ncbi:hypothetical protein Patl1_37420 [Pistacia atlantica]|nr:hypothetical protein Patl1_37420 [Pistacia atlantica]
MKNSNSKHRKKKRKSLSRGLPLFSEVGAEARDLLEKGYIKDHEFSISARSSSGTTLASAAVKLGKHSSTYLAAKYNCKNATIDVKVDLKSQLSASLSFSGKFSPSTTTIASLKLPHYSSSEVQNP